MYFIKKETLQQGLFHHIYRYHIPTSLIILCQEVQSPHKNLMFSHSLKCLLLKSAVMRNLADGAIPVGQETQEMKAGSGS
jgi:hypothetical protein